MTRSVPLPVLFLATLVVLVGPWCWWRQAPTVGSLTSAPQEYVGHGDTPTAATITFLPPASPEPRLMLVFGDPITLEVDGSPIAWIEKTGGKGGKPRVRIKDSRVADTVRALLLMTLWPLREKGGTTEVEEWVERLKK